MAAQTLLSNSSQAPALSEFSQPFQPPERVEESQLSIKEISTKETPRKHIIILGAGVTGLQTALSLQVSPHNSSPDYRISYTVHLIASHHPGDKSINYTSPWAGAHWRSHAGLSDAESNVREWDAKTYDSLMWMCERFSRNGDSVTGLGLGKRESRNYWGPKYTGDETMGGDGRGLWWSGVNVAGKQGVWKVKGFEVLDLETRTTDDEDEKVPDGAVFGIKYQSVCINVPMYLEYLYERVKENCKNVVKADIDVAQGLEGVVRDAKRILLQHDTTIEEEEILAVINCTGLGARHFVGEEEAAKLYPIRGQTLLVKGEAKTARTYVGFDSDESNIVYVVPRPWSGTTILGGCKQTGDWSGEVDEDLSEKILERVKRFGMAEELRTKGGNKGDFEVLSTQVGLRPGRKGGPRVEVQDGGKVEGCWVVHSYGHAGAGYQNSWGCGVEVVKLVKALE